MRTCLDEELVEEVADDGIGKRVLETVPRSYAQENKLLTWTSQVIVMVDEYVLVTRRSLEGNKRYGGFWEIGITETVMAGERKRDAARWGIKEELKIPLKKQGRLVPYFKNFFRDPNDERNRKNAMVFLYYHEGEICYEFKEIAEGKLLLPEDIDNEIAEGVMPYTPMNIRTWEMYKDYAMQRSVLHARQ